MAMKQGETYRCSDPNCGCEVRVTQGARSGGSDTPRCCCGQRMQRVESGTGGAAGNPGNEAVAR